MPREVFIELQAGGLDCFKIRAIRASKVFVIAEDSVELPVLLNSQLDKGEASVIQNVVMPGISVVAIDKKMGRLIARLHALRITGSVGILIKAAKAGLIPSLETCFERMHAHGIWISRDLQEQALQILPFHFNTFLHQLRWFLPTFLPSHTSPAGPNYENPPNRLCRLHRITHTRPSSRRRASRHRRR